MEFIPCDDDEIVMHVLSYGEYRIIKMEDMIHKFHIVESEGNWMNSLESEKIREIKEHLDNHGFEGLPGADCFRVMHFVD